MQSLRRPYILMMLSVIHMLHPILAGAETSLGQGSLCPSDFLISGGNAVAGYPGDVKENGYVRARFYEITEASDGEQRTQFDIKMPNFEERGVILRHEKKVFRSVCGQKISLLWFYGRDKLTILQVSKEIDF